MQHTGHPGRDTTRRTAYRGQLFGSECSLFHFRENAIAPSRETVQFGTLSVFS